MAGTAKQETTSTKVEYYYYTGTELTYITDQNNALKYFFVRDTNGRLMHMLDYKVTPVKAYTYIHDVHGNIVALADDSGSIVVSYEYDAWGVGPVPTESVVTGNGELLRETNPFRYSGYQCDVETGLYYLKARYYSPGLGRFLTMDPMIGVNRYVYAGNNPVKIVDYTGLADVPEGEGSARAKGGRNNPNKKNDKQKKVNQNMHKISQGNKGVKSNNSWTIGIGTNLSASGI